MEIGITLIWSATKLLFSEQLYESSETNHVLRQVLEFSGLREKRGNLTVRPELPPLFPRNIPSAIYLLITSLPIWVLITLSLEPVIVPNEIPVIRIITIIFAASIFLLFKYIVFNGIYISEKQFTDCSTLAIQQQAWEFLLIMGTITLLISVDPNAPPSIFVLFVIAKTGYELLRHRPRRIPRTGNPFSRRFGKSPTLREPEQQESAESTPIDQISPSTRGVYIAAIWHAIRSDPMRYGFYTLLGPVWFLAIAGSIETGTPIWFLIKAAAGITIVLLILFIPAKIGEYVLRYRPMTYEFHDGMIIGYDTWLDEQQWRCTTEAVTDISISQSYSDRYCDTQTVTMKVAEGKPIELPHLPVANEWYTRYLSKRNDDNVANN